jgi:hypothetical protein
LKTKIIITLLICFNTLQVFAQKYSTIKFITNGLSIKVYIADQLVGNMNKFETLEYKVYSEGRIPIVVVSRTDKSLANIDVKHDSTYYFIVPPSNLITKEKAQKFLAKSTSVLHGEEDLSKPIIDSTNSGPKQGNVAHDAPYFKEFDYAFLHVYELYSIQRTIYFSNGDSKVMDVIKDNWSDNDPKYIIEAFNYLNQKGYQLNSSSAYHTTIGSDISRAKIKEYIFIREKH